MNVPRRDLVFVSAGLGLDGGGRAAAGRLLAGGCAAFARERGIGFRLLSLDGTGLPDGSVPIQGFAGDQRALALAVWKNQLKDQLKNRRAVDAALLGRLERGFLLIAGRMDPRERYKGHDQILEALKGVEGVRLVVAGDGDDRPRLEQKAAALEIGDRVIFTGFLSEATLAE